MILYAPTSDEALQQAIAFDEAIRGPNIAAMEIQKVENRMIAPWAPRQ